MAAPERTVKITADGQLQETPLDTTSLLFIKGKQRLEKEDEATACS